MNSTVLNNFLDRYAIDSSKLKVHYSFDNVSGEIVWNSLYSIPEHYTGDCLLANKYPGVSVGNEENPTTGTDRIGTFRYTDLLRVGYQLTDTDWTVFLDLEPLNHCDDNATELAVLAANKDAATDNGFLLGLNKSNRLVFENWQDSVKTNQILFDEIADGAVISLTKNNDSFELVYHNHPQSEHNSISFDLTDYSPQNNWYLGGLYTPSYGYTGLSGYFNNFLYFNSPIEKSVKNGFSKAFFVTGIFDAYVTTGEEYIGQITDVTYNPSGSLSTGVISYDTSTVLIPDHDSEGADTYLCLTSEVTGVILGETIQFTTGAPTAIPTEVLVPAQDLYDYAKLLRYSKSNLVYEGGLVTSDILEIYSFREPNDNINLNLDYDPFYQVFKPITLESNIYFNGLYQESGFDYTTSDLFVKASGFTSVDGTIYDAISGNRSRLDYPDTGVTYIAGFDAANDVYLNGQKLISGLNYTGAGSDLFLLNTENLATGILQFVPRSTDIYEIKTGNFDLSSFKYVVEQAWLNGQRLKNRESFIRTNSCTIRGVNDVELQSHLIYDNDDNFWDL